VKEYIIGKDIGNIEERVANIEKNIQALKSVIQNMQVNISKQLEEIKNGIRPNSTE